ncbi:MAG: PD-(D/E)XK nuclease family protein [Oscillospiraceae bacterium]
MLRLVVGRAGSGKSEYCINEIERLAHDGERSVLIVPEQSSFSFERALALRLDGRLSEFNEIKSFKKLCDDIFSECGGGAKKRVTDAEKCAILRRAMLALGPDVHFYRKHRRDRAFFTLAVSVIDELKNGGVSPEMLRQTPQKAVTPLSKEKLSELALIYEAYDSILGVQFYDDADQLNAAAELCTKAKQFDGAFVFLDGYSGFTEPEFTLIANMLVRAKDVCCTLVCDDIFSDADDSFSTVRMNGRRLMSLAKRKNIEIARPVVLEGLPRFKASGIISAEKYFGLGYFDAPHREGIYQISGKDLYDEAQRAACEIQLLVRNHGYRYNDIAVIARDTDRYRFAVERTFERFGIPLFSDINRNMLHSEFTVMLLNLLELAGGWDTDYVFRFLKTGLCDIDGQTVGELENYCFVWNVEGSGWCLPFDKNPNGFGAISDKVTRQTAERIENARKKTVSWLDTYIKSAQGQTAAELIESAYRVFESCGAVSALENSDDAQKREAAIGVEIMEQLHELVGTESFSVGELIDFATILAGTCSVGDIPQCLEQVVFGTADRMRTNNPRAVFLIGLNDGIFPKSSFDAPILSSTERDLLFDEGIRLSRNFEQSVVMEKLFLYRAVTASCERVYMCSAKTDQKGTALQVSPEIDEFIELNGALEPEFESQPFAFAVNKKTAASAYADAIEQNDEDSCAAIKQSEFAAVCAAVDLAAEEPGYAVLDTRIPQELLGQRSALSATKIEQFEKCRFAYFLKYVMRIRPLQKAEISPIEAGSFVHKIMENTLRAFDGDISNTENDLLRSKVCEVAESYVTEHIGDSAKLPRVRYLVERLKAQSVRLVMQLKREQQQSEFRPCDYELSIGDGAEIEPLEMRTLGGETVYIEGSIDRVDILRRDGKSYIRVVDYKTGDKAFSLTDVFYGLNVQMLLYLFTVCKNGEARYGKTVPAAVMYIPSDPNAPSVKSDAESDARQAYKMDGLVIDNPEIVSAMERDVANIFIPVLKNKDGSLRKSEKIASLEKLGLIERHIEKTVTDMANALYMGEWDICPTLRDDGKSACDYCDYAAVCRHDRSEKARKLKKLDSKELFAVGGTERGESNE